MSTLLTSQSAFAPRKEFLKNQSTTHQFALLTFNGAEILRLSNFPPNVIASLRTLFQQQLVYRAYREDPEMGVSEFIMADRLWTSKNVKYADQHPLPLDRRGPLLTFFLVGLNAW